MTFRTFAFAAAVIGSTFGPALAESGEHDTRVPIEEALRVKTPSLIEGRQAAVITTGVDAAEAFVVGRNANVTHNR
jgi:hypothetical protein